MKKLLIFNFDGTDNEPSDAQQEVNYKGAKEDDNISNIAKFQLMLGGHLKESTNPEFYAVDNQIKTLDIYEQQYAFYYHGIGTYGSRVKRAMNAVIAMEKSDVSAILNNAVLHFTKSFMPGDKILVTGFSRGAALGRRFVALIDNYVTTNSIISNSKDKKFVIEAMFDTVASFGSPNLSKSDRPETEVLFENGSTLPSCVEKALHCLSLDDKRKAFQPTLMNFQKGVVHELWFAGAHSDVGGGYYRDGLSDVSLQYFLDWIQSNLQGITFGEPSDKTLENALNSNVKYKIQRDDIVRNPNPFGKNHQQDRWPVIDWLTLSDRVCCVSECDKIVVNDESKLPIIHWSVAARINGDKDYKPKSLKNITHNVIYRDGRMIKCIGLNHHINTPRSDLQFIEVGDKVSVTVFADQLHNHTGLMLAKDATYTFEVFPKNQTWVDKDTICSADGWTRDIVSFGSLEFPIKLMEPFRRVPNASWFCLCGNISKDDGDAFLIGRTKEEIEEDIDKVFEYKAKKSGEFLPFANDVTTHYGNNSGSINILVTRIG